MIWGKERRSSERIDTLIAKDVVLKGDLEFSGGVQIDGTIEGTIKGVGDHSVVRITSQGQVRGDIHSPIIVINGSVKGSVYSSAHLELGTESHIAGDVHYQLIEMLMGAEVNGQLMHEPQAADTDAIKVPVDVKDIPLKAERRQAKTSTPKEPL